jgi:sulfite reductase alpha subunit-like flavoprotein
LNFISSNISSKHASSSSYKCSFKLELLDAENEDVVISENSRASILRRTSISKETVPFFARVAMKKDLRNPNGPSQQKEDVAEVMHFELEIPKNVSYQTADNLGIFPRNDHGLITRLAKRMNIDLHQHFKLHQVEPDCKKI